MVELKTADIILPIHEAQPFTYLRLQKNKGILLNFNCTNRLKKGQKTFVTNQIKDLPKGYYRL